VGIYKCTWKRTVNSFQDMPVNRSLTQSWRYGFFNCNYYNLSYWHTFIFNRTTSQKSFCFPVGRDESSRSVSYVDTILTTFKYMILFPSFIHCGTGHHGSCNIKLNTKVREGKPKHPIYELNIG